MGIHVQTSRFGTLDIEPDALITFTQPIIGFQDYRRFVLAPGPEASGLSWLQSTENGDLAFLMIRPTAVFQNYKVTLQPLELAELAAPNIDSLEIYTLLVVPEDKRKVRTNLKAPILINPSRGLGKQTVLESSDYPIQFFLAEAKPQEAAHARSDA